jgi:hypothetical protein
MIKLTKQGVYDVEWFKKHKILTVIGVIVVLAIAGGASGGNKTNTSTAKNDSTTSTASNTATAPATETKAPEPAVPAEYKTALTKAKQYSDTMHMSKQGIYDQLVSPNGEKYTAEAAQYAVDNLKTDYNANALAKAKQYQTTMSMSPAAIHDQLTSANGEKFTAAEADYAVAHL